MAISETQTPPQEEPKRSFFSTKNNNKQDRTNMVIGLVMILVLILGAWLLSKYIIEAIEGNNLTTLYKILGFILLMIPGGIFYMQLAKSGKKNREELHSLQLERRAIEGEIKGKNHIDVFDSIRLSLNKLEEYYTINTNQARHSFTFSLLAIILGLAVLIAGIMFFYVGSNNITLAAISSISGIIVQFIGGAYFVMYKKSLSQLNRFYEQLIIKQNTMLAINLSESIKDEQKAINMKAKIIDFLLQKEIDSAKPAIPSEKTPN
ncbi:TRADD-N-associated membrane domain-containing protein [Echinicola rosea]|nr:hypothetical protein [Echinicola rosea]